jgi:hypothetical protein
MIRIALLILAAAPLSGYLNFQADYDNAARAQCREVTNQHDRQACFDRVENNSRERRAEQRKG